MLNNDMMCNPANHLRSITTSLQNKSSLGKSTSSPPSINPQHQRADLTLTIHWGQDEQALLCLISNLPVERQPHLVYERRAWIETGSPPPRRAPGHGLGLPRRPALPTASRDVVGGRVLHDGHG